MRPVSAEQAVDRAAQRAEGGRRVLIGITGPPGAGKSTLAARLAAELGERARVAAMDGFHLAQSELERLGRAGRKGAPDTFDAAGFVALLRRLRAPDAETVYAPEFRRAIEEPVAGAIAITPEVPVVVTEGNYLLLDRPPWSEVRRLLDEVWFVSCPEPVRLQRLIARHRSFGRTPEEARRWALGPDGRNAALIEATRARADLIVRL